MPEPESKVTLAQISWCLLGAAFFISLGLGWLSDYEKYGYYYDVKAQLVIRGPGALVTIYGLLAGGVVFAGYAVNLIILAICQRGLGPPTPPKTQVGAKQPGEAPIERAIHRKTQFDYKYLKTLLFALAMAAVIILIVLLVHFLIGRWIIRSIAGP